VQGRAMASRSGASSSRSSVGDEEDAIVAGSDVWLASWYYFGCMHG
jgi:hypothetical protein